MWSVFCCFCRDDATLNTWSGRRTRGGQSKNVVQLPSFLCLCTGDRGQHTLFAQQRQQLCSPLAVLSNTSASLSKATRMAVDKGMCSGHELGVFLKNKQGSGCLRQLPLLVSVLPAITPVQQQLLPFPASCTSHFHLNYYYPRPQPSVALFDGPNLLPILFLQ